MDERTVWLESAVLRWEKSLIRTAYAYLGDRSLAEDAVQETFLKAWRGYDRFRGRPAKDVADAHRDQHLQGCSPRRVVPPYRPKTSLDQLPEGSVPFTPREDSVTRAVLALPPRLREVVLIFCCQGLTAEETAQVLGISRSTVFHRMQKARAILQKEWGGPTE
jgi:RNA polymerase sigma-70 factor (ECF subfamily)